MGKRFNIRAYGIWVQNGKMLVNEELIRDQKVIKFPGGGLDWGEGIADCLKREWKEELDIDITIISHFYTTDFFQHSAFDDSQVVSIYYLVTAEPQAVITNHVPNERTFWMDCGDVSEETFTLPIDKKVGGMLQALFAK
jgi:ADP-ribose pyrophosphatase YjhB (NUDIX family)